jgi:hypothetical protein
VLAWRHHFAVSFVVQDKACEGHKMVVHEQNRPNSGKDVAGYAVHAPPHAFILEINS